MNTEEHLTMNTEVYLLYSEQLFRVNRKQRYLQVVMNLESAIKAGLYLFGISMWSRSSNMQ